MDFDQRHQSERRLFQKISERKASPFIPLQRRGKLFLLCTESVSKTWFGNDYKLTIVDRGPMTAG